jgi:succinate dehydrogenase/fumarate reductase flavoprotein subunit
MQTEVDNSSARSGTASSSERPSPGAISEVFDVVVLGGGVAGLTAATVAACEGLRVLLLEKESFVGGTSAISGGACWIPHSHHGKVVNPTDTPSAVITYLRQLAGERVDTNLVESFLKNGPLAVEYLEARTSLRFLARPLSPDYRPQLDGGSLCGRVLEPLEFDARKLGESLKLLRPPMPEFTAFNGMMVTRPDATALLGAFTSLAKFRRSSELLARYAMDRFFYGRGTRLVLGNALVAALLKSALDAGVAIRVNATPTRLTMASERRVRGVEYEWRGTLRKVDAVSGVVLATGGLSGSPLQLNTAEAWLSRECAAPPNHKGGGMSLALSVNAVIGQGNLNDFSCTPVSVVTRHDNTKAIYPHLVLDRQKPGIIAVNSKGVRFANEADSYHDFVESLQRANAVDGASVPAFLICDRSALKKYGLGAIHPGGLDWRHHLRSGYLIEAPTIADLARKLDINPESLGATVARSNSFASTGVDPDFGRGSNAYHRFLGDAEHQPNPCLGVIEKAPFYAVRIWPGVQGSARGLSVNAHAQVLDRAGSPIQGLYACGNDMNSIFAGTYPGPGITLGPAITFGYVIGKAMRKHRDAPERSSDPISAPSH